MNNDIVPELKTPTACEAMSRLATLGWPVVEVTAWSRGRMVKVSGKDRPTITAEGVSLFEALTRTEREATIFLSMTHEREAR